MKRIKYCIDATTGGPGALQSEAKSATQILIVIIKKYGFVRDRSFFELEDLHELKNGLTLHRNANLMLAHSTCDSRSGRGPTSSAHDVFCREDIEANMKFMSCVMAAGAHGHNFCSERMLDHRSKSLSRQMKMVEM